MSVLILVAKMNGKKWVDFWALALSLVNYKLDLPKYILPSFFIFAGSCTVRWENKTMYCIVSVFGLAI